MPERVTLLLDDLLGGGAARVAATLSEAWAEAGREVTLLTTDDGAVPPFYPLHPAVRHVALGLRSDTSNPLAGLVRNLGRVLKVRRALRASRPDLLVSFLDTTNILCLLATRGLPRVPTLVSERTDPAGRSLGFLWGGLRRLTYPWADCLVTQSARALAYFPPSVRAKGRVIPNPVLPPVGTPGPKGPRPLVITVGRLSAVKGHDLLIEAFAQVADAFPDWDLAIFGEGPERARLEAQVRALGQEGRVRLPGATQDVAGRLGEADLFVLPSRVEGFPNALAEAMACGVPVVSFDCPSGPSELIREGVDGLLVPPGEVPALAGAMARLMGDPQARARLAARAPEVLARFSLDRILALWEAAIAQAMEGR